MFKQTLKSSFEHFLNINQTSSAALMARYVDKKLRGEKGASEIELEAVLDKVMLLFRYLQGKDIFEAFYKKHLAKRLLLGKSSSYELEKSMLTKLKTVSDATQVNPIQCLPHYIVRNVVRTSHRSWKACFKTLSYLVNAFSPSKCI